jgi:gliding motility-associated-like protein
MRRLLLFLFIFSGTFSAFATHNRAGEITYRHLTGFEYEITVTTYTNTFATTADRCEVMVYFGDGDSAAAPRINGPMGTCAPNRDGDMIASFTRLNIYKVVHQYDGPGNYNITMEDPNRNAGICNIPGSVNQSFFLITQLRINPFLPPNTSPVLLNPPIDEACVGQCFEHNPGAYDVEGDSLYYTLTKCYANGAPIIGYSFPPGMNVNSIDHNTGDLVWCVPTMICQYNVAILIEEWKLYPGSSERFLVGTILRDMQIDVANCSNVAPQIPPINDTCILAGTSLSFNVTATDPDNNVVTLTATGGPFLVTPPAVFATTSGIGTASGTFSWSPDCGEVQLLPYQVTFKAKDNDMPTPLVNFESVQIRVIAPPVTGLSATPSGSSIIVSWAAPFCSSTTGSNPLIKYKVYRKNVCEPFIPSPCETGVPASSGYTFVGSTLPAVLTFTDNNGGAGLTHGVEYSYLVVAEYADGSQTVASANVCAKLVRDVPIITNVSVISTGGNDSIWTHWLKPRGGAPDLDTIVNPPPYEYRLMRAAGLSGTLTYSQVASYTYPAFWQMTDTGYVSSGLNTEDSAYTFRVDFYSNGLLKGSTQTASSVYLSSTVSDNQVNLTWQEVVPWSNYRYDIYRETSPGSNIFNLIDSSTVQSYIDTGLTNGVTYCYKIISFGQYSDTTLPRPLVNVSQIKCDKPLDTTPPCQPNFLVANDCGIMTNTLSWQNPNTYCSNDAVQYNVYFAPSPDVPLALVYSTNDMNNTTYQHIHDYEGIPSVAGCYAVTAVDSSGNESPKTTVICVDNCPVYELPNVFTPNGDNTNDLFIPLPYRYVKDVDITIYDRWGLIMFQTSDPDVEWDGTNRDTGLKCSDGTYFYVCIVNEIRLEGIVPRTLKGFVQLINTQGSSNK